MHFTAHDWRAKEADPKTRFRFAAYRDRSVKATLHATFHGLCAYCETPYPASYVGDVEHYRPKAAVDTPTERGRRPGYYWLASTWENLLPSCARCNRPAGGEHGDGPPRTSGKGNAFPLEVEADRATAEGEEARERALLLHPYYDDPDRHLAFVEEGLVRAHTPKGTETIRVLGLNRRGLLERRRTQRKLVEAALLRIEKLDLRCARYPDDPSFAEDLRAEIADLKAMQRPGQPYSAVVRHGVRALTDRAA